MEYTYDSNIVSDLHKDARGFRPTVYWMVEWDKASPAKKQAIWDDLAEELEEELAREAELQTAALERFSNLIKQTRSNGAASDVDAIRWIIDAEGFDSIDLAYGEDYVAYHFGLKYDNPYKTEIRAAINAITG